MEKQPALKEFMDTYNLHLINDANLTCSMTRVSFHSSHTTSWTCRNEVEGARLKRGKKQFGIQSSTCYNCLAFACSDHEECKRKIDYCGGCDKYYCHSCVYVWHCTTCKKSRCDRCEEKDSLCYTCGKVKCRGCAEYIGRCHHCGEKLCIECGYVPFRCSHCPEVHKLCGLCSVTVTYDSDSDYWAALSRSLDAAYYWIVRLHKTGMSWYWILRCQITWEEWAKKDITKKIDHM